MAHLTDESKGHQHQADPTSKCAGCRELVKASIRSNAPTLGKSQSTIRRDEEPLSK